MREAAAELLNERLIAKLSEGDLVATESKYYKTCLADFYNKGRTFASKVLTAEQEKSIAEGITVAEIECYMRGIIEVESDNIPVLYLKEFIQQVKDDMFRKLNIMVMQWNMNIAHNSRKKC